jgi:SanA protein
MTKARDRPDRRLHVKAFVTIAGALLDSIVRVREIFGQEAITVISQEFHNERAIFIARHRGIDAIAFNAAEVDAYNNFKTKCRELTARADMLLDLFVFRRAPKFLGEKVMIPA